MKRIAWIVLALGDRGRAVAVAVSPQPSCSPLAVASPEPFEDQAAAALCRRRQRETPRVVPRGEVRPLHPLGPLRDSGRPMERQALARARRVGDAALDRAGEGVREARPAFNPVKFNADEWVKLAKDAGMKYIVITSKHHDGFALFKSAVSKYNIVDATPFKRDVLKELADACARGGIRLGFYYSQSQDWHERNGAGNDLGLRPRRQEGLRPVPARQGRAAGEGAADQLRAGRADLVRHAAHDDRRSRAALREHRPR